MRASLLISLAILAVAPFAPGDRQAYAATQGGPSKLDRSHAGQSPPAATFLDHAGAPHRIADFAGKPILVNLWATWCAPCIAEMPALDRLAFKPGAPQVIAVSQDLGGWRAIDRFFVAGKFVAVKPFLDRENALALGYKAAGLPITILYDAKGLEVWRVAGPVAWDALDPKTLSR